MGTHAKQIFKYTRAIIINGINKLLTPYSYWKVKFNFGVYLWCISGVINQLLHHMPCYGVGPTTIQHCSIINDSMIQNVYFTTSHKFTFEFLSDIISLTVPKTKLGSHPEPKHLSYVSPRYFLFFHKASDWTVTFFIINKSIFHFQLTKSPSCDSANFQQRAHWKKNCSATNHLKQN